MEPVRSGRVMVVGSIVMDVAVRLKRQPRSGETVFGTDAGLFLGGKGFNQAVAARRAGAHVAMAGRVGDDPFGAAFVAAFDREGINHDSVVVDPLTGTGIAVPMVDESGQNSIIIVPRANALVSADTIAACEAGIRAADVLMLQMEINPEASLAAAQIAAAASVPVLWNPAPLGEAPARFFEFTSILVANEIEAAGLTGSAVNDAATAERAAYSLHERGIAVVVVTLGNRGLVALSEVGVEVLSAHHVPVIDTTGAGDAFCGALAAELAAGAELETALRFANAAGALAVTRLGAEPSLPAREAIRALLD